MCSQHTFVTLCAVSQHTFETLCAVSQHTFVTLCAVFQHTFVTLCTFCQHTFVANLSHFHAIPFGFETSELWLHIFITLLRQNRNIIL